MGINPWTYLDWEKDKTEPVASQFLQVIELWGFDPTPAPTTLAERLVAKRRATGITFDQAALQPRWDPGTLTRYLNGTWRMPDARSNSSTSYPGAASPPEALGPAKRVVSQGYVVLFA